MKSIFRLTFGTIQDALKVDHPYSFQSLHTGTPCGVLMLISLKDHKTVLMKRPIMNNDPHSGQISFPGGRVEPEDHDVAVDMRNQKAALREFQEETGFLKSEIEVVGSLPEISTPSGYQIFPFVGITEQPLSAEQFNPNPEEVQSLLFPELHYFLKPTRTETRPYGTKIQTTFPVLFFSYQEHEIWGATAAILNNFIERLKKNPRS